MEKSARVVLENLGQIKLMAYLKQPKSTRFHETTDRMLIEQEAHAKIVLCGNLWHIPTFLGNRHGAVRVGGRVAAMGQAGSQPAAAPRRPAPHEPLRRAPKVLPSLSASPRLRSTDNGAILQSGGTISGRRPHPAHPAPSSNESDRTDYQHQGVFRSRSAGAGAGAELRARERDPLHRSHTNLDLRSDSSSLNKRFGSEPDLRNDEEQPKSKCNNKHFRKKYRAPPPPADEVRDESSPDSSNGNARTEPPKKLRLFKTRTETKKMIGQSSEPNYPERGAHLMEYKSLDYSVGNNDAFERRYRSPYKMKEQNFKYPDSKSMLQSNFSLKREENVLQDSRKPDNRNSRISKIGGCKAKMSKSNESNDTCKTPLFNRDFRNSERFKRENSDIAIMRREKSFDATLIANEREADMAKNLHANRMKAISEQLKDSKLSPLTQNDKPFRKSLPSLLTKTNEEKDEFQTELKKATSRFRNELSNKKLVSENKPSQNDSKNANNHIKANPTKNVPLNKVKESSLKTNNLSTTKQQSSIPKLIGHSKKLERLNEPNLKKQQISNNKINCAIEQNNAINNQDNRNFADRGQASGKESTPEHSPTRYKEGQSAQENLQIAPSKQFYFGMIESKQTNLKENLKDFPGLGSPIIEEISNFHLIEKKLLSYQDDDAEFNKFNEELDKQNQNTKTKNISSESALSSDGSEGEGSGSEDSLGIALRLRPTIPKKQPSVPRFSPAAAWRQLAHFDAHLTAETQPLAVETKVCGEPAAESSPRSEQSGDKSGDSGISGDHAHSDPRLDSPARQHLNLVNGIDADHAAGGNETWTPQQDLGDSSSDGAGALGVETAVQMRPDGLVTYSARGQPFSLSLPREPQEKVNGADLDMGKPLQQGFNSLQKLKKSVSGALGAALGARRFDLEHEPMLPEAEQNWFLTKSAPTSLSNPLLLQHRTKGSNEKDIKEENSPPPFEKDDAEVWRRSEDSGAGAGASYLSWGGHVMYLPPAPRAPEQPLSLIGPFEKPIRSKSSGELEVAARAARARAGAHGLAGEMRERDRSASPGVRRALPARVEPYNTIAIDLFDLVMYETITLKASQPINSDKLRRLLKEETC
ncbi:hypothetical protein EVAR_80385_1 [Eumeta japonica]|uniref:Uncharacterized protein n=1 Tax=Eumeta variegata TaxID=151549 RepID=A0A4C1VJK8_EUMVA|nr:hypothetical protein EVAR_80385_1 [Eumeta japonica]